MEVIDHDTGEIKQTPGAITKVVRDPAEGHAAMLAAWDLCKALTMAGKPVAVDVREWESDRSIRQNRYYWGVVLKEISAQARVEGQRYTAEAWHELGKRQFLGYEIRKVTVAGRRKKTVIRSLRSTTKLKVKAMSDYLERFQAFAATELGVRFSIANWQDYVA